MKQHFIFRQTILSRCVLAACGASAAILAVQPVFAQTAAPALQRVEVTGSNVPRADIETPSPVQIITADDLKNSGYTTITEVLQSLTANGAGSLSQGFSRAFSAGASGVSLRGLTLGATLVLIDGHRMAAYPLSDDGQRSFVDISSIPFSTIERIEILKDGASAVYGSDAIAGVVNVILKRNIEGTQFSADLGTTEKGGGSTRNFSIARGFGDANSSSRGYISLEARHADAVKMTQRSGEWLKFDWRDEGGLDLRPGARNAITTNPRTATPRLQIPGSSTATASNFAFYPGCDYASMRASLCTYTNTWAQLQPETDNLNLLGRFETKIASDWDLRLTGSRFQSKTKTTTSQAAIPTGTFAGVTAIGAGLTPAILGAIPVFRVPANYPGNTLGVAANISAFLPDAETRTDNIDTVATRFVAEVNGNKWGWDMNAAVGYTRVETSQALNGYINFANLLSALNSPTNPYLLSGGNSAAANAFVSPTANLKGTNTLTFLDFRASRELMQLPGGPLALGTGFSFNHKNLNNTNGAETRAGTMNLPSAYAVGTEKNTAIYAELVAPVTKQLELDAAVRLDHFSTFGNAATPKVAFKFSPSKEFTLRGTASRGFRAPSAAENGTAGSLFGFNAIRDPLLCPVSNANGSPNTTAALNVPAFCNFNPVYLQATTKDLKPEKSKSFTLGLILEPVQNWSTTLDFYKIQIDGQIVSESAIAAFDPLTRIVRGTPQNATFGDGSTGLTPAGTIQYVNTGYVNAQTTSTSGIEFETRYKFKLQEASSLTVGLQLSHVLKYTQTLDGLTSELSGTHGPSIVGGNTGNPKNRAQFTLAYATGPWTVTSTTNYVGTFDVTDPSHGALTCLDGINANNTQFANGATPPDKYCKVRAFHTTNLSAKYQQSKALTFRASILNLFGAKPPVDLNTYGGTGTNGTSGQTGAPYNPSLHQAGAIGRAITVGLDYKF